MQTTVKEKKNIWEFMWTNFFSFLLSATSGNNLAAGSLEFCFLTGFDSLNRQWGQELQFDPLAPSP